MNNLYIGVPFSGCDKIIKGDPIIATREDEAIGIGVGAWLAGRDPKIFMQNSGFGNCIDIITSLLLPYGIDLDIIVQRRDKPAHHWHMDRIFDNLVKDLDYETIGSD